MPEVCWWLYPQNHLRFWPHLRGQCLLIIPMSLLSFIAQVSWFILGGETLPLGSCCYRIPPSPLQSGSQSRWVTKDSNYRFFQQCSGSFMFFSQYLSEGSVHGVLSWNTIGRWVCKLHTMNPIKHSVLGSKTHKLQIYACPLTLLLRSQSIKK